MDCLTIEELYFLHQRLIQHTGGTGELRDPGLLLSAVDRPRASFDSEDPDLFIKAAVLMPR